MHDDKVTRGGVSSPPARDAGASRPRHCWTIARQNPSLQCNCEECYAYFAHQDCWTRWASRQPGFKLCCQKKDNCAECVVLNQRMKPLAAKLIVIERTRHVCPAPSRWACSYLQLFNGAEQVEGANKNAALARTFQVREADVRCRLRGVHLDLAYVHDVCASRHIDECVFLEETRSEVRIASPSTLKQPGSADEKRTIDKAAIKKPGNADEKRTIDKVVIKH
jgi:hypothetical protein